jgi:hypothetical protein
MVEEAIACVVCATLSFLDCENTLVLFANQEVNLLMEIDKGNM